MAKNEKEVPRSGDKLVLTKEGFSLYRKGYIIVPHFHAFPWEEPTNEQDVVKMGNTLVRKHGLEIGVVKGKYPLLILELKRR